jgi:hypothetical protein
VLLTNIGYGLSGLIGPAIIGIRTRFLRAPPTAAAGFGIGIVHGATAAVMLATATFLFI